MPASTSTATASAGGGPGKRQHVVLVVVALTVLAFNLRPGAISVAPVLGGIRSALGMSPAVAGLLTTLPVLCFAVFGWLAPWLARLVGVHRVMLAALVTLAVGLGLRATTDSAVVFLATTTLALAGAATANVMLPALVKRHLPDRVGAMTALYTTSLAVGLTLASVVTVPIAESTGSWRVGIGIWSGVAALAALPWLGLVRRDVRPEPARQAPIGHAQLVRSRLAWAMAVYFGLQSLQAYAIFGWLPQIFQDAGLSAAMAGALLGVVTGISIPIYLLLPSYAGRRADQRLLVVALGCCYLAGYAGLLVAPAGGAWLWAALVGIGGGAFPLCLTLLGLRAHTGEGTAALSGFAQGLGYLIAAIGPFGMGFLYGLTGGWTVPLWLLLALVLPQMVAGLLVARPRYLEDELA